MRLGNHASVNALIPSTDQFGSAFSDLVRCRACGHMQLAQFPTAEELIEAYRDAYSHDYVDEEPGQRAVIGQIHGGLTMGDYVRIAAQTVVIPANHVFTATDRPIARQAQRCERMS